MAGSPTIARLRSGGRIWALGALLGDAGALEVLAEALLPRWRAGDELVVLGNMLGAGGDSARTLDLLLRLRRRLMAIGLACDVFFLRGAQEEMWHKTLGLQFALSPLEVLDWMLARGLAAVVEAYGASVVEGRIACRSGPSAIARWTFDLRERQAAHAGHAELLNTLMRAALAGDGRMLLSAAGIDARRPLEAQADAFWWSAQGDAALDAALATGATEGWGAIARVVRGLGPSAGEASDDGRVLTIRRALVGLDPAGELLERIET